MSLYPGVKTATDLSLEGICICVQRHKRDHPERDYMVNNILEALGYLWLGF